VRSAAPTAPSTSRPTVSTARPNPNPAEPRSGAAVGNPKDAFLAEIRKQKLVFYQTVVAQAQKIEVAGDTITFAFSAAQKTLREMFEQNRGWLESVAQQATGRRLTVSASQADAAGGAVDSQAEAAAKKVADKKSALRQQAMADAGVQTMLEVFPAEIRDVEEL
jgi:hypothetical protein